MARIAIPLADGFEDSEYQVPRERLEAQGHECVVVGREAGRRVTGKRGQVEAFVDAVAGSLEPASFDALLLPGGWSPDRLRTEPELVALVRHIAVSGHPVAAICHGPQLLIEAEVVAGRTLTSTPAIRKDLENAGAIWEDRPVVQDGPLLTSRRPDDLDPFCEVFAARLAETRRAG